MRRKKKEEYIQQGIFQHEYMKREIVSSKIDSIALS